MHWEALFQGFIDILIENPRRRPLPAGLFWETLGSWGAEMGGFATSSQPYTAVL